MRRLLYVTVFFAGLTTLALEMSASRLLGNYFGTSNLVWASIIGLILIYLTAGYFLGGVWADRSPKFITFYQILIWSALAIAMIPLIARPVLRLAADAFDVLELGVLLGSFAGVMVLFSIPVTLLGTASPFAIRLALHDSRQAGSISGTIYAISTLGAFLGTFLPPLWWIPTFGTYRTFLVCSAILLITGLVGLGITSGWRRVLIYAWTPAVPLLVLWLGLQGSDKTTRGLIYETESAYNYIQVLQEGEFRLLRLNEGQGIHSIYHPTQRFFGGPWEQVLIAPFFNPPPVTTNVVTRIAIVGLAAGTTALQATEVYPHAQIDGFEIDPRIVEVARQYFGMNESNLNVIIQDGRWGLATSPHHYQIISLDAYRPPYIPWHMTTVEFFQIVYDHLTPEGVAVVNVGRGPQDRRLLERLSSTMQRVFPSVHVVDLPGTFNSLLYATRQPTDAANLWANYEFLRQNPQTPPLLLKTMELALANLQPTPTDGPIFTDDLAPVEQITNTMVLDYLLFNPGGP
ncbi:fused MFS/spermidine synthase [uncultured Thermanaerothrix sp.]|uniref:spermidine synthase n=1 Tax=uncultured Thermanaerothrix sp. TaxID=1195149 RepID=UPI00260A55EF|nr:fused MFS/spermidine synthase [uncultured Thermanaerothrix sp.]